MPKYMSLENEPASEPRGGSHKVLGEGLPKPRSESVQVTTLILLSYIGI